MQIQVAVHSRGQADHGADYPRRPGVFSETFSSRVWAAAGVESLFVQDNHSLSRQQGVVRGLHFRVPPHAQGKLVRVLRGSIFDVAVDIRVGSPTYGGHIAQVLSAAN